MWKQVLFSIQGPPTRKAQYLRKGSIFFAFFSLSTLAVALHLSANPANELNTLWQPVLMVLWLAVSSRLIDVAVGYARRFDNKAKSLLDRSSGNDFLRNHVAWITEPAAAVAGILFSLLGFCIVLLVSLPIIWKVAWSVVIISTFYYAGYGIWGAWVVTKTVKEYANEALENNALNAFHGDKYCGLGFALRYADIATLFMLTGITALPMAVMLAGKGLEMSSVKGLIVTSLVALALIIWGVFTFVSSVSGRSAIAHAVSSHRYKLLDEIALEKKHLIEIGNKKEELELLNLKEEAVLKIKTGIFSGAGAWKDLFSVGATGLALINVAQDVQKVIQ